MCPYVNFEDGNPEKGWTAFYDPPRYSSGYATLFNTIAFIPETHMLKPFRERVHSTYALLEALMEVASKHSVAVLEKRKQNIADDLQKKEFALSWKPDTSRYTWIHFKGYETYFKPSEVTGAQRLCYDHTKPFEKQIKFNDFFLPGKLVMCPKEYVIPQGWHDVIDLLRLNGVIMRRLTKDSVIPVQVYYIDEYSSMPRPYEKHHKNSEVKTVASTQSIHFLRGDYLINTNQASKRFLIEMLEPQGDDSYFSWNFFDAVLQQKEGYSEYRWEDLAASYLKEHPEINVDLEEKKKRDTDFAKNPSAQLGFVYKHSFYYEQAHLRYPVYGIF